MIQGTDAQIPAAPLGRNQPVARTTFSITGSRRPAILASIGLTALYYGIPAL
jgi:hypothetical protein